LIYKADSVWVPFAVGGRLRHKAGRRANKPRKGGLGGDDAQPC
jgi:hypothetical protein